LEKFAAIGAIYITPTVLSGARKIREMFAQSSLSTGLVPANLPKVSPYWSSTTTGAHSDIL